MTLTILEALKAKAQRSKKLIALGDAHDERMLTAAILAKKEKLADIVLVGDSRAISESAIKASVDLSELNIFDPGTADITEISHVYFEARKGKLASDAEARAEIQKNPLLTAALLTRTGKTDGVLAGSLSTTGDVIRAALKGIGTSPGISVLSSMFLMCFPKIEGIREEFALGFGDCAVLPDPTAPQLADIAISSATTYQTLTGNEPKVAMLSFSTKGSAETESTQKVIEATGLAKQRAPKLALDGELQFDAAFIPEIGIRKAKGSDVA
ncbi:MAG TPA: phosphate acyltransferase, partial [Candidatus Kapabacteria bacterium]|nr:phosphate acyltransferase [Candidatus Kapabacteria bacterium]